ncbi:hypothetical protein PRIC1_014706 [Phytophthora ramorum]|uniref:Uncharacterized protein n=1 Tax=Phytophthora ramorum TaxID=164328 RepID=H3GJK8_PHYRM|nr:hypothetical protein KRP23_11905 [Phytophthora ramorum]
MSSSSANDVVGSSANSTSSESSADAEIVFTSAPKTEASNDGDSCTWYSGGICSRPRSCSDCLNVALSSQDCAVSPYGECMSSYMLSSVGGYPMSNFSYCSSDDVICTACRTNWTRDAAAGQYVDPTAMCVGSTGCICLASCALPDRDDTIVNNWCVPALDGSQFRLVAGLIAGTIALFVVATVITKRQLARRQRQDVEQRDERRAARAALRETRRPAASAHLPQLNLSGWAGMREKLVSTEQERLGGTATKPTLARTSTVPPAAIVEEGDGYRPMSPSEHPPRREL